jgi:acetyl-CoA carboxylase carboxyl transferase subunit alpha
MKAVDAAMWEALAPLLHLDGAMLRAQRREKFLDMGRDVLL